jgi:SOS response regulatory protein OraA/RecX
VALHGSVTLDGQDDLRTSRPGVDAWRGDKIDMALPTLTPEQRAEALKKAAAARTARKELRDAIARGEQTIPAVLDRAKTDQIVGKTKVADLLKSLPGYGPAKVSQLLEQTGIDASRRAAGLGDRQRQALIDALK